MKTILIAVILQATAGAEPDKPAMPQVMSSLTAELESKEACLNAAAGLSQLGNIVGFAVVWSCAAKDIAKLEVEKPKAPPAKTSPSSLQARS